MKVWMPEKVKYIIRTIHEAGYEAFAVGGCVRDSILGRVPDDWDITTSARPEEVKSLFRRTVDTGIQHGTVTVLVEKEGFEVTTYRIDGEYLDSRHPEGVTFTQNLVEDLKRRDFTINAMAYNDESGLVDVFDGLGDINKKIVRCVGSAEERFNEDALRIMRAIRFSAQLGYKIEEETAKAIKKLVENLKNISAERIQVELVKLVTSPHPEYLRQAYEMGITHVILPEWDKTMVTPQNNPHHCYSVGEHILHSMMYVEADKILRLTMMLHDIGKPVTIKEDEKGIHHFNGHEKAGEEITKQILRRLKFDNDTIYKVSKLVLYHDRGNSGMPSAKNVRHAINQIGEDVITFLFDVKKADLEAQSSFQKEEKMQRLLAWKACYEEVLENKECVSLKMLAVTGSDLIAAGMEPGKELGETLSKMLEIVLDNPEYNTKDYLLSLIK